MSSRKNAGGVDHRQLHSQSGGNVERKRERKRRKGKERKHILIVGSWPNVMTVRMEAIDRWAYFSTDGKEKIDDVARQGESLKASVS